MQAEPAGNRKRKHIAAQRVGFYSKTPVLVPGKDATIAVIRTLQMEGYMTLSEQRNTQGLNPPLKQGSWRNTPLGQ